jgi:pimeloyl-ACP methyl ester carboxylesterase
VPLDGLHIVHHHTRSDQPRIVIVHGAPDRSRNFAKVLHLLADLPVTAYDRRGYGRSLEAHPEALGFTTHADDLIEILDGRPAVVVGQSAGGTIAMLAATHAPELFLALGVWEPPMVSSTWWSESVAWIHTATFSMYSDTEQLGEDFNRTILGDERWESLPERTRSLLRSEGQAFRADMTSQLVPLFDLDDLNDLKIPMVVGSGALTHELALAGTRRLAERANAEYYLAERADHFAHTTNPSAWAELVRRTVAAAS